MKRFISKVKKSCRNFINGKAAFSLVELIVVIAIMAVMAAVLAPALLGYVERSRAQKDDSAMSEIVNSIQLSLADQDVYDEMLIYAAEQYSCYVDSDSPDDANKVDIKAGKYYMYNDNERQLDEIVYKLDGVMRGVTITFAPDAASSNKATFDLIKGHVNKYLPSGKKTYGGLTGVAASPKLADIPESELYNSLRATIGDKISISSQTYRNSEYTIFISMGTTGGQEAAQQDAIKVWGQFSGTNLPEGSSVAGNTSTGSNEFKDQISSETPVDNLNPVGVIPDGATYIIRGFDGICRVCGGNVQEIDRCYCGAWEKKDVAEDITLTAGQSFPDVVKSGDIYRYGDYEYCWNWKYHKGPGGCAHTNDGWCYCHNETQCWSVHAAEDNKETYGEILESINEKPIISAYYAFMGCYKMKYAPIIPDSITDIDSAFIFCSSLISAPVIPSNVKNMSNVFYECTSLAGSITVNAHPSFYRDCLYGTQITEILGSCPDDIKAAILATK